MKNFLNALHKSGKTRYWRGFWRSLLAGTALLLSACSALNTLNGLTPQHTYRLQSNLPYGQDARQRLDIYRPLTQQHALPVVVFFYGGSWSSGDRRDYAFVGEALAARGIITVVADYRLYPQVSYPDFLKDSAQAVAWTLQHISASGGDPQRLFLMGHSAGAYNTAMLALDTRWLAAFQVQTTQLKGWIGLAGPYDFLPIIDPVIQQAFHWPATPLDSQPVQHVRPLSPPALLLAGMNDTVVDPLRNTQRMAQTLQTLGVPVTTHLYPRINHGLMIGALAWPLRWTADVLDRITEFVGGTPP